MSWWFAVRDGEETVAALRSIPGRRGGVYVTSLGVRAGWRGRGIGKALLTHTFAQAWDRGIRRVALGVDTRNSTGATALYRAMGMIVEAEMAVYEAALADIHGLREGAPSGR
jgi:ribosomal protein S18 acetylase RimI-like enzyme